MLQDRATGNVILPSEMIAVMPATASRRTLLRLTGVGIAGVALTGCSGERRRTPWSPTPDGDEPAATSPPDLELLLAARDRIAGYRRLLSRVEPAGPQQRSRLQLAGELWPVQQERIETLITLSGVDLPAEGASSTGAPDEATGTTGADGASGTAEPLAVLDLGRALREDLPQSVAEVAGSTPTNRALLASLTAEHAVSAQDFGAESSWPMPVGPTGSAVVPVLAATRPAVFGLEVVSARSTGEEREQYESVLAPVQALNRTLTTLADGAAPVAPLGYDLPEPLESRGQRERLARDLVHDIAPAALSVLDRAGSSVEQVESLVRIVVEATVWARRLGSERPPFPGMTLP